jgi:predicted Zn-dependent protease with MMP-like domain
MILDSKEFELLVRRIFEKKVPREFLDQLENVDVVVEELPPESYRGNRRTLLGLFEGVPKTEPYSMFRGVQPSKITLFEKNILASVENLQDLEKLILEVMLHEIAHYFGYSERQMVYMDARLRKKLGRKI